MAGYSDTRQLIINTLMGRPAGAEIQPEDHQAFALALNDYIRSVELVAGSGVPVAFAEPDTVPVQPNNGQAVYLSYVPRSTTKNFVNFINQSGNSISVASSSGEVKLVTLLWNGSYWSTQIVTIDVLSDDSSVNASNIGASDYASFSPNSNYSIGDIVKYDGKLYQFITEHTAGAWIGTDADDVSINSILDSKITELKKQIPINNIITKGTIISNLDRDAIVVGSYINANNIVAFNSNCRVSDFVKVKPGADYLYFGNAVQLATLSFFDKNKNYISKINPEVSDSSMTFITPDNCEYIRYCSLNLKSCYVQYIGEEPYNSNYNLENLEERVNEKLTNIEEKIDFDEKARSLFNIIEPFSRELEVIHGYYISSGGLKVTYPNACITKPILIKKNEIILLFAKGANSGDYKQLCSISKSDSEGTNFEPIVIRGGYDLPVSQFIAEEDCYITLSWLGGISEYKLYMTFSDILENLLNSDNIANLIKNSFSKETSKVIASTLYDANGDVITNTLPRTYGCYLMKNNVLAANWDGGGVTDYIVVNGLKQIHYSGYVTANPISVAFCLFYDKDKNFISSLYTINSDNASGAEGEFTTTVYEMDIDVPVNAYYARFTHNLKGGNLRITAGQYLENTWLIDVLRKAIENSVNDDNIGLGDNVAINKTLSNVISLSTGILQNVEFEINVGSYVSSFNSLAPLSSGRYSNPIPVKKGEYYIFIGEGGSSGGTPLLATISETDENASFYKSVVIKGGQFETNMYSQYYAKKDGYIALSWLRNTAVLYKTKSDILTQIYKDSETTDASVNDEKINNIDYVSNEGFTYFLDKCICIGDSVTDGHVYDYPRTPANGRVIREQSYPTYLKKMTQWSIVENAARAGISVVGWWQTFYPDYTYTDYQIALMELGYNGGLTDTLDTDVEAYSNYNDYAETNTGCYCKIIEAIKEANPHIYLVLLIPSLWTPTSTGAIVIRKIAQKYNLPIIDLSDKTYMNLSDVKYHGLTNSDPNSINMVHFNAIGHCAKAKFIWNSLNKLFQVNAKEVNDLQPGIV